MTKIVTHDDYVNARIALFRNPTVKDNPGRYSQCDNTCTVDCGHCKGKGK